MRKYHDHVSNARLRAILEEIGVDYKRFATLIGKSTSAVHNWIVGVRRPSQEALAFAEAIADVPELKAYLEEKNPLPPKKPRGKPFAKGDERINRRGAAKGEAPTCSTCINCAQGMCYIAMEAVEPDYTCKNWAKIEAPF